LPVFTVTICSPDQDLLSLVAIIPVNTFSPSAETLVQTCSVAASVNVTRPSGLTGNVGVATLTSGEGDEDEAALRGIDVTVGN